jgi:hypothetical protein
MDSFNIGNKSGTKGKHKSKNSQIDFAQNLSIRPFWASLLMKQLDLLGQEV